MQDLAEFWNSIHPGIKVVAGLFIFWGLVAFFYGRKMVD